MLIDNVETLAVVRGHGFPGRGGRKLCAFILKVLVYVFAYVAYICRRVCHFSHVVIFSPPKVKKKQMLAT